MGEQKYNTAYYSCLGAVKREQTAQLTKQKIWQFVFGQLFLSFNHTNWCCIMSLESLTSHLYNEEYLTHSWNELQI